MLRASFSSSGQFIETLIDLGADVNAQRKERKETPLILAADWNNYMAAFLLVRHGADLNVQISNGFTALHLSVKKKSRKSHQIITCKQSGCKYSR